MQEAMVVFKEWLDKRKDGCNKLEEGREEILKEKAQRLKLVNSFANAHSRSNCSNDKEFNDYAKSDKADAVKTLRKAAQTNNRKWFMFSITSFVAMFGGPGDHGYGRHVCTSAKEKELSSFFCLCDPCYVGVHRIICDDLTKLARRIRLPFKTFHLIYHGESQSARFENVVFHLDEKQKTIGDFFSINPRK